MTDTPSLPVLDKRKIPKLLRKEHKMTIKFRKWLSLYIQSGNATDSARQVYKCNDNSAQQIGYQNVRKLEYTDFLEQSGITDKLLVEKLRQGLDAVKIHSSHTEPDVIVDDMGIRHKYLETALKLKRRLVDNPTVVVSDKTLILDAVTRR